MSEVDPIIHQPTRLRIMAALVGMDEGARVDFSFLIEALDLSDGNLSVHLQKLEKAKLISIEKTFVDRYPKTWVRVTKQGRKAFEDYVESLEGILGRARPASRARDREKEGKERP
jgi:DNA-binding MarR family transcriptional regulator